MALNLEPLTRLTAYQRVSPNFNKAHSISESVTQSEDNGNTRSEMHIKDAAPGRHQSSSSLEIPLTNATYGSRIELSSQEHSASRDNGMSRSGQTS